MFDLVDSKVDVVVNAVDLIDMNVSNNHDYCKDFAMDKAIDWPKQVWQHIDVVVMLVLNNLLLHIDIHARLLAMDEEYDLSDDNIDDDEMPADVVAKQAHLDDCLFFHYIKMVVHYRMKVMAIVHRDCHWHQLNHDYRERLLTVDVIVYDSNSDDVNVDVAIRLLNVDEVFDDK